jgi:parvulin-like peptidyl-prolyl isomerase
MNGTDAQSRTEQHSPSRSGTARWLWTLGTVAGVVAACVAIRQIGLPQAAAQAPVVRPGAAMQARPAAGTPAAGTMAPGVSHATPRNAATGAPAADQRRVDPAVRPAVATPASNTLQVMAVVNTEQITRTELGRECIRRYGEEVLESMVNRQLIADACAQRGIQITDADVSAEIDRVAGRFGLARDRWLTLLREERGYSEEQYRREVIWPMLALKQVAAAQVEVTPDDLKKAFESEFGEKIQARLIAVDSREKAEQVRALAVADPNQFGDLSKQHSIDAGVASSFGVIPPIRRHLGDANLEKIAFALQPGQISEVINVANMYYILKCEKRLPAQYLAGQQLADQQAKLKEKLKENKLRMVSSEFFEKVQKQAQIVNVLNDPQKQQQMPGVAATVNGRQITLQQLAEECLTRHGTEVLDGEINRKILQQELNRKHVAVADQDIDAEVARAADAYGFLKQDGTPDVEKWLKSITEQPGATVDLYIRDAVWPSVALKKLVGGKIDVTADDLKKSFESNYGERVEALAIVLSDQRQAQKVWDLARNNPTDAFFGELAQQYSIEPSSRANGGKIPPIRRYGGSPVIEEAAFKLQQGELSGIIAIEKQFIILRCLGRTRQVQPDFNAVKSNLQKDIEEKKLRVAMTQEFDRLREAAQVDNFLAGSSQNGRRASGPSGGAVMPSSATAPVSPRVGTAAGPMATPGGVPAPRATGPAAATAPRAAGPQVR